MSDFVKNYVEESKRSILLNPEFNDFERKFISEVFDRLAINSDELDKAVKACYKHTSKPYVISEIFINFVKFLKG